MLDQIKKLIPLFSVADYNATSSYASYFKSLKIEINNGGRDANKQCKIASSLRRRPLVPSLILAVGKETND